MAILTILALTILCVMTSSTISIQAQAQTDQQPQQAQQQQKKDITTGTSENKKQQNDNNDKQTKKDSKKDKKESSSTTSSDTKTDTTTTDAPIQSFLPAKTLDKQFPVTPQPQPTNDNPVLVDQQPQQPLQQQAAQAPLLVIHPEPQKNNLKNLTESNKQVLNEGALSLNSIPFPSNNNNGAYGNYSSGIKKGNTLDNNTVIHDYKNGTNNGGYHKPGKLPNNCTSKYDNHTNMTTVYCYDTVTKKQYIVKQPIVYNKVYPTSTTTKKIYVQVPNDNNNYITAQNNILKSYLAKSNSNNNDQPSNLLLLDSAQLCAIAGDLNCVTVQSYFKTLGLITTFDAQHQKWFISASVKNIATPKQDLKGLEASIIVYNENGDNIGKAIYDKIPVQPDNLNTLKDGSFSTTIPLSDFKGEKGNPTFIVINYNIQ